jgi:hypothetical protein
MTASEYIAQEWRFERRAHFHTPLQHDFRFLKTSAKSLRLNSV